MGNFMKFDEPMTWLILCVVVISWYYLTRLVLSIDRFLIYQKTQVLLLAKIARASEVPESEISAVFSDLGFEDVRESKASEELRKQIQKL